MTYKNLRVINELGGIQAQRISDDCLEYFAPGSEKHKKASAGEYGDVEGYVPSPDDSSSIIAYKARRQRNKILKASDWTQVADAPVDQAAWATYRQALRDIPQQAGFPDDVTWPTKPE